MIKDKAISAKAGRFMGVLDAMKVSLPREKLDKFLRKGKLGPYFEVVQ